MAKSRHYMAHDIRSGYSAIDVRYDDSGAIVPQEYLSGDRLVPLQPALHRESYCVLPRLQI